MKLDSAALAILGEGASQAAARAGALVAERYGERLDVKRKPGDGSEASQVVTEVDLLSQEMLLQELAPLTEHYDLAVLAEEDQDDGLRLDKEAFWAIDPLDGTLPFVEQVPGFAVSVALVAQTGEPLVGAVFEPTTHSSYLAVRGQGLKKPQLNKQGSKTPAQPWRPSQENRRPSQENNRPLRVFLDRSFLQHPLHESAMVSLGQIARQHGLSGVETSAQAGAVMNAVWALESASAVYFKPPRRSEGGGRIWDYAATACLYSEAGAAVSDVWGKPLELNRAASSCITHQGIVYATTHALADDVMKMIQSLDD